MSSDNIAISVSNISKCYNIYQNPRDRLKQFFLPKVQVWLGNLYNATITNFGR